VPIKLQILHKAILSYLTIFFFSLVGFSYNLLVQRTQEEQKLQLHIVIICTISEYILITHLQKE